jgi:signal transduction histidine kinase
MVKGEAVGLLCVDNSEPEAYAQTDGELVMAFANHAALAIANARLYEDAQRRLRQLAALQEVSLEVGDSLELPTVLDAVTGSALRLVDAGDVHIFLYDDGEDQLRFGTGLIRGGELLSEPVQYPRPNGVTYTVARTGRPVVANDVGHHPLFGPGRDDWGMEAIVGLPIKHGGHVVGVLTAACVTPHVFTPEEVSVLELLAERAAAAIEHARLYDEARRRLRQVEALQEVSFKVGNSLDLPAVLEAVVGSVLHLVDADDVHISLYDAESDRLQFGAGMARGSKCLDEPIVPTRRYGVTHTVARSGEPLVINQPHHHRLFADSEDYATLRALVGLPLKHGGRVLGVLIAACANSHTFTSDEVGVLELFADRAATAIKHAQLVDRLRESERRARRLNEELGERLTELGRAQTRLVQSEKMAAVGQLVSGVAHELNNPLTTILGYSQLLVEGNETAEEIHDDAERIFNAAARSAEVVRSLLKFSRRQKPERVLTDVNEAVEEALSLRRYQFRVEGVELVCELDSSLPPVLASPHRLQEVVLNLVINGEQAMVDAFGSGRLVVRTRARPDAVRIEVEDSGPGIPDEIIDHIFEPFFTTKEVGQGTGLGLSICYGIVEEHGGRIWVETRQGEEDHGSRFIVELPTGGEESAEAGQHPEPLGKGIAP